LKDFTGPVLVLPDAKCLNREEQVQLEKYWKKGHTLVLTGETGRYNWEREEIPDRFWKGDGSPRLLLESECPGKKYEESMTRGVDQLTAGAGEQELAFLKQGREFMEKVRRLTSEQPAVEVTASPLVAAQICRVQQKPHVFLMNFQGLKARESAVQKPVAGIRITFPAGPGNKVRWLPFLGVEADLPGAWKEGKVTVTLPEFPKSAVIWVE
jgi:hypothetical protein